MTDLQSRLQQKLMEDEFRNKEPEYQRAASIAPEQPLFDELQYIKRVMATYDSQAHLLRDRLRKLQKNYYDDMSIVDETVDKPFDQMPWNSTTEYTRNKYASWKISSTYLGVEELGGAIHQVAIRKNGYDNQIKTLNNICERLNSVNAMAAKLYHRKKELKEELNIKFGKFVND